MIYHLYSDDLHLLCRLAISAKGIALLPRKLVSDDIEQQRLVELLAKQAFTDLKITLIYPSQPYLPENTRAMVLLFSDAFNDQSFR